MSKTDYSLYLVTDSNIRSRDQMEEWVRQAILGGVTLVQLREKHISTREFYQAAVSMKEVTQRYHVPLIINDRLDIALAAEADGLHIGQSDLPAGMTKRLLGEGKILGLSAGNLAEAKKAEEDGADYVGVGAVFPTSTKADAVYVTKETLREIKSLLSIPVVAIGGINKRNMEQIYGSGIDGVAVVSAIMGSDDPKGAAHELKGMTCRL